MSATAVDVRPLEELVDEMVAADSGYGRACAYGEILRAGMGGCLVADRRCGSPEAPIVVTVEQLYHHLIKNRGRVDHTGAVVTWSPDDGGRGPGMAGPR